MQPLSFITEADFRHHVAETIRSYGDKLKPFDLSRLNANLLDPVKLLFDKSVYRHSWEEIVRNEIFRQRDKSSNNDIGYFHQKIFQYFPDCTVPDTGWDVVLKRASGIDVPGWKQVHKIYVELKNKHNTMNSASSTKTYMKMQAQILDDDDSACFLVEVIAKKSQNEPWIVTLDRKKRCHNGIRRVSIDRFYSLVTGQDDAFFRMCERLPQVIDEVLACQKAVPVPHDTAVEELKEMAQKRKLSFVMALYMLGFGSYPGFDRL